MKRKIAQTFLIMMQQFKVQKEGRASRIESLSIAIALYLNYYKNFKFYLKEKVYYKKKKYYNCHQLYCNICTDKLKLQLGTCADAHAHLGIVILCSHEPCDYHYHSLSLSQSVIFFFGPSQWIQTSMRLTIIFSLFYFIFGGLRWVSLTALKNIGNK